jgi:hypothetical protein
MDVMELKIQTEFKILCSSCESDNDNTCLISLDMIKKLGIAEKDIKITPKDNTHCISFTIKASKIEAEKMVKEIFEHTQDDDIKQIIINPKLGF